MNKTSKLYLLQENLRNNDIDFFVINRTDEFLNEYIAPYAERLQWLTNFSGSAGKAIIAQKKAILFVDGRYTSQAKAQINADEITLNHNNNFWKVLKNCCRSGKLIGLDPKLHSIDEITKFHEYINDSNAKLIFLNINPIDFVWKDQPAKKYAKIFDHPLNFAGLDRSIKIKSFQNSLKEQKLDYYFLTSLDSIAWLLNIRGDDIKFTPIAFLYLIISKNEKPILYVSMDSLNQKLKKNLIKIIELKSINKIEFVFKKFLRNKIIGMDFKNTAFYFYQLAVVAGLKIKNVNNPCLLPKAIKNPTEIEGARNAFIRDGVSLTKFLYWLKNTNDFSSLSEKSLAEKLFSFRKANDFFHSLSFESISAIGKNAALPHYKVSQDSNSLLLKNSIYLIDSGAQYLDGTTDITRTIIIGIPTEEQKDRFTRVLKGHISLSSHVFKKGTKGTDIDYLARESLNEIGYDYDHGTGHGIGSFLNVHEGPQRIGKKNQFDSIKLAPGMILSNEPGYYKEGEYGIRIENILVIKEKDNATLEFENISWTPIDKNLIIKKMLNDFEIKWVNNYHNKVYKFLVNFLNQEERKWLKYVTTPL